MQIEIRNAFSLTKFIPNVRIVIDVFRASTTIIALLEKRVEGILINNDIETLDDEFLNKYTLVTDINGFGFDNSPTFFNTISLLNNKILFKSSNLTKAIELNTFSGVTLIACFNNLKAVIDYVLKNDFKRIEILPAGSMAKRRENMEDSYCAEEILKCLKLGRYVEPKLNVLKHYVDYKQKQILPNHKNEQYLKDLQFAIKTNLSNIIPFVKKRNESSFFQVGQVN